LRKILFVLFFVLAFTGVSSALTLKISDVQGSGDIEIPVLIENAQNVGSMDIVVTYDPEVIKVKSVSKGDLVKGLMSVNTDNEGIIAIGIADSKGISGSGTLATIVFESVKEGESELVINKATAYDVETHVDIAVEKKNGKVTVLSQKSEKSEESAKGTPGFEIIYLIAAISLVSLLRKRRWI